MGGKFKKVVQSACKPEPAPPGFRERLLKRLLESVTRRG